MAYNPNKNLDSKDCKTEWDSLKDVEFTRETEKTSEDEDFDAIKKN